MTKKQIKAKGKKWLETLEKIAKEHQEIEVESANPDEKFLDVGYAIGNLIENLENLLE